MSVLAALVRAYDRIPNAPPFGFSTEKISFVISLHEDGVVANVIDIRSGNGKKMTPHTMQVPQPSKRSVNIAPNFLWDKTSYVLGVTDERLDELDEKKRQRRLERLADEHTAFIEFHRNLLENSDDPGLIALDRFLESWIPEKFTTSRWPEEMKGQNIVFALESERKKGIYIHDHPASKLLWEQVVDKKGSSSAICLVTAQRRPIARLHPSIKGVWGSQSSGASIVSFNKDAYTSYDRKQGKNAPVSELATFKYTTALTIFLTGTKNRIQVGDTSIAFWADASNAQSIEVVESIFGIMLDEVDEISETNKIGTILERIRKGILLQQIEPDLTDRVRFFVLGLAPNAARLSVRFWLEDDFGTIAKNYQRFVADMTIIPPPKEMYPALRRYLLETAVLGKRENIPPNLAGEWMRSILTGTRYPLTLLSTVLMRIGADKQINEYRVAMLRAVLVRNFGMAPNAQTDKSKEAPVSLDPDNRNKGYLLGRLFAAYERAQMAALGNVNATIKDKFYGAASAQPRKVFPLLERGSANHLSKVGKQQPGYRIYLEKIIGGIMERMTPDDVPFPTSLPSVDQAMFGLGYYHQRNDFFRKSETNNTKEIAQ